MMSGTGIVSVTNSDGQAKLMIANGEVTVNGQPESRKTAKIRSDQMVQSPSWEIHVLPPADPQ